MKEDNKKDIREDNKKDNKKDIKENIIKLFCDLVKIDTQSDPQSNTYPSTKSQLDFAQILKKKCIEIGLNDTFVDEHGYVIATLKSNIDKNVPTVAFIAHMDTSPEFSGKNINPQIIQNYDGNDILLKNGKIISVEEFEVLNQYKNQTLITTDGNTLLGADDKAGICEILTAMEYLVKNPQILHGDIKILFTPDEEIGKGVAKLDLSKLGADVGYTLDGSQIGELEFESFNAARVKTKINGKNIHPGLAKNIMKNAALIAAEFSSLFPLDQTPQSTEGYEGFYHLTKFEACVESANLEYIVRDFDRNNFEKRKEFFHQNIEKINKKYDQGTANIEIDDQYYNMGDILKDKMWLISVAEEAFEIENIKPIIKPIRGGTDGSKLSFMGLPCPNIFAGGHNFHSPFEFVPVESMLKATNIIINICEIFAKKDILN